MSEEYDGHIRIDTKIDTDSLDAGANEIVKELKKLTNTVDKVAGEIKNALSNISTTETVTQVNNVSQAVDETANNFSKFKEYFDSIGMVKNIESIAVAMNSMKKSVEDAANKAVSSTDNIKKGMSEAVDKTQKSTNRAKKTIQDYEKEIENLKKKMNELNGKKIETADYKYITKEIQKAESKLSDLLAKEEQLGRIGVRKSGVSYRRIIDNIEQARIALGALKQEKADMEKEGEAYTKGTDTQEYKKLEIQLQSVINKMKALSNSASNADKNSEESVKTMQNKYNAIKKSLQDVVKKMGKAAAIAPFKAANNGGKLLVGFLKKITSGFKKSNSSANVFDKTLGKTFKRLAGMTKTILVFRLFRQALTELSNYMKSVLKTNTQFMGSLGSIKGNLLTAFQPIYEAIMPALNTLMSALVKISGYIAQFTSTLFGKSLKASQNNAKALYSQAKATDEVTKATKNASKALGKYDELNVIQKDTPSSSSSGSNDSVNFDEIEQSSKITDMVNNIKKAFATGDFTEIGAALGNKINSALEMINWDKIKATADKTARSVATFLNGAILTTDWSLVGTTLGNTLNTIFSVVNTFADTFNWGESAAKISQGINSLTSSIDWNLIYTTVDSTVSGIVTSINGFNTNIDWAGVGQAITIGLGTILVAINSFTTQFDAGAFSSAITTMFNSGLSSIDWNMVSQTASGVALTLVGTLNGFIQGTDWNLVRTTITNSFDTAIQGIRTAVTNFDWMGLGEVLAAGVNSILDIDWAGVGQTISDIVSGLLDMLIVFVMELDWVKLANDLVDLIMGIDWLGLLTKLIILIVAAIMGLAYLIYKIPAEIGQRIGEKIKSVCAGLVNKIKEAFTPAKMQAAFGGIKTGLLNILNGLKNAIKTPINGVLGFFQTMVDAITSAINTAIGALNKINVKIPDWSPIAGGKQFGFNIPNLKSLKIPKLATGTVVPKGFGDFPAILGDNKKEAEVVSPISTMKQAFIEAISESGLGGVIHLTVEMDSKIVYEKMIDIDGQRRKQTGKSGFAY